MVLADTGRAVESLQDQSEQAEALSHRLGATRMIDEETMQKLVCEISSRLTMMEDEWDYEIAGPRPNTLLGISGGGNQSECEFMPIRIEPDGSRHELPARRFRHTVEGTFTFLGKEQPNFKIRAIDNPSLELYDWLRSDPWSAGSSS
jgi:hypothetical protein